MRFREVANHLCGYITVIKMTPYSMPSTTIRKTPGEQLQNDQPFFFAFYLYSFARLPAYCPGRPPGSVWMASVTARGRLVLSGDTQ